MARAYNMMDKERKHMDDSQNKPEKVEEQHLTDVTGGSGHRDQDGSCYFTPDWNGGVKQENGKYWHKCASNCFGCFCRFKDWCVGNWHEVNQNGYELEPRAHSNHKKKPRSNDYNTT